MSEPRLSRTVAPARRWRRSAPRIPQTIDFAIDRLLSGGPDACCAQREVSHPGIRAARTRLHCRHK